MLSSATFQRDFTRAKTIVLELKAALRDFIDQETQDRQEKALANLEATHLKAAEDIASMNEQLGVIAVNVHFRMGLPSLSFHLFLSLSLTPRISSSTAVSWPVCCIACMLHVVAAEEIYVVTQQYFSTFYKLRHRRKRNSLLKENKKRLFSRIYNELQG